MISRSAASAPLMFPQIDGAKEAFGHWDYFALVRYRSMRDLVEAIAELTEELGGDAMFVLKHSGVERTFVIPVYSNACEYILIGGMLLTLWSRS